MLIYYVFILILGLIFGSFITSFTYRIMLGEILPQGRSHCPNCKSQILWYDNIPLFSYFVLKGKCRACHKHIGLRYPLIELSTAAIFVMIASSPPQILLPTFHMGIWTLPFLLLITCILIAIFVIDYEFQLIPDELSLAFFIISFSAVILFSEPVYPSLLSGFSVALFLLMLHLITYGRGMGLGDVKLSLGIGILLGWPHTVSWLFSSFVLGAIVGIALLISGQAKLGKHIAFGPFLVIGFFIVLFFGDTLTTVLMPYL
jgi:leader peptidase (prepilin peptidase) / N-methyltransferase